MRKAIHGTVLLLMLLLPAAAHALDLRLGTIEARSETGAPVEARIPIRNVQPDRLAQIEVGLAPARTFSRVGVDRPPELSDLRFEIVAEGADAPYIEITSRDAIDLELLDFLVELRWPEGNLVREYTLLLDPPTLADEAGNPPVTAEGAQLRDDEVQEVEDDREAGRRGATVYGPIESGDTLWSIARENRPSDDVTVAQTMMAILEENPHAFRDNNVNNMTTGYWLRLPSEEQVRQRSAAEAQAEFEAQVAAWTPPGERERVAEPDEEVPETVEEDDLEARLEVLAPEGEDGEDLVALLSEEMQPSSENVERLQRQLALAEEDRESLRAERDDLEARVQELTERVEDLERLLELRAPGAIPPRAAEEAEVPVPDMPAPPLDPPARETVPEVPGADVTERRPEEEPEAPDEEEEDDEETSFWADLFSGDIGPMEATREAWDDPQMRYALLIGGGVALLAAAGLIGAIQRRRKRRMEGERRQGLRLGPDDLEFDFDNMGDQPAAAARQDDEDVIDRAQRYLDRGDPRSARQELLNGVEAQPARSDVRLKLMEVQADLDDRGGFNDQARALYNRVRSDADPIWQAALTIGQRFTPPLPQFDEGDDAAGDEKPELEDLDLGLADDDDEDAAPADDDASVEDDDDLEQRLDEVFGSGDDDDLDDLLDEPDAGDEAGGEDAKEEAGGDDDFGGEMEEMDLDSLLSEGDDAGEDEDTAEEPGLAGEQDDEDNEDDDEPAQPGAGEGDEVDTKLDLARAYIDLGDEQGARELLEEALEEGTENQKSTARRLLSELSEGE